MSSEPHRIVERARIGRNDASFVVLKVQRNLGSPMGRGDDDNSVILSTRVLIRQVRTGRLFVVQPVIATDGHGATLPGPGETIVLSGEPINRVDAAKWPYLGEIWELMDHDDEHWWMMPKPDNYKIAAGQRATPAEVIRARRLG